MKNAIWITWERQPRNRSMANIIGAELYEFNPSRDNVLKYLPLILRTIVLIVKRKPGTVFVQNPSIVLSTLSCLLKKIIGYRLVIDEHNAGLFPAEGKFRVLNRAAKFIVNSADFVIVTNAGLKKLVESWGGSAIVMPDPLPVVDANDLRLVKEIDQQKTNIFFVCSWSADEPYNEVFEAASELSHFKDIHIYITGNYKKTGIDISAVPKNVTLLGFISERDYYSYFNQCSAAMVLTTREDCMTCGAYEAVSLGKPGILSNTAVIKNYFNKGYLYADCEATSITSCIALLRASGTDMKQEVVELKEELTVLDEKNRKMLEKMALIG